MEIIAAEIKCVAEQETPGTPPDHKKAATSPEHHKSVFGPEISRRFVEFRLETNAELSLGLDKPMDKSMQSLAAKMGERIGRVEERMTLLGVAVKRIREGQREILEPFRRLAARTEARGNGAASTSTQSSRTPAAMASAAGVSAPAGRSNPECSVLLVLLHGCMKACMKIHIANLFQAMPTHTTGGISRRGVHHGAASAA